MPLSMMKESRAMMMPNRARKTQSSPRRANVCFQTHDEMRFIRVARLPNSSCKYFPALLLYKPMRSTLSYSTLWYYILMTVNNNRQQHGENWQLCQVYCTKWRASAIQCVCVWVSVRMRVNFFRISIQFFTLNTFRSLRLHIYQIYIVWISLSTQFHFNTYLIPLFIFLLSSLFE